MAIPGAAEIARYVGHHGWRRTTLRSSYVAANKVVRLSLFGAMSLRPEQVAHNLLGQTDRYVCRLLEPREMRNASATLPDPTARSLTEAADRNDLCCAVFDGDQIANLGLFSNVPTPLVGGLHVHFEAPCWYMHGGATLPAYRGQKLHARSVLRGALALFDRGVPKIVTLCECTNYSSLVSAQRMGWESAGLLWSIGRGARIAVGASREARALGMSLSVRSGPG